MSYRALWVALGAALLAACSRQTDRPAVQRIVDSPLAELVVSDTIPLSPEAKATGKIRQVSIARLLGEAIKRMHSSDSVSSLFA